MNTHRSDKSWPSPSLLTWFPASCRTQAGTTLRGGGMVNVFRPGVLRTREADDIDHGLPHVGQTLIPAPSPHIRLKEHAHKPAYWPRRDPPWPILFSPSPSRPRPCKNDSAYPFPWSPPTQRVPALLGLTRGHSPAQAFIPFIICAGVDGPTPVGVSKGDSIARPCSTRTKGNGEREQQAWSRGCSRSIRGCSSTPRSDGATFHKTHLQPRPLFSCLAGRTMQDEGPGAMW